MTQPNSAPTVEERLATIETELRHVATKKDVERLTAIETELRHVATKKDVERLKVWVLTGSGTVIVGVVITAVTWLIRLLGP